MHEIFINYRNGDEEASARVVDQELSSRFGSEQVFRASKSIPPGDNYIHKLLAAVRNSTVLLAIIGSRWLTAVDEQGHKRLHDESDWIRREILEAFENGVRVIPVLVGRKLPLLHPADLPAELVRLAECQYRRLDHRNSGSDLRALGDELVKLVPSFINHDRPREESTADANNRPGSGTLRAGNYTCQMTGGTNTVVNDARGPVNTGSGHQFTGDGVTYVAGKNHGGIHHKFGSPLERVDDER